MFWNIIVLFSLAFNRIKWIHWLHWLVDKKRIRKTSERRKIKRGHPIKTHGAYSKSNEWFSEENRLEFLWKKNTKIFFKEKNRKKTYRGKKKEKMFRPTLSTALPILSLSSRAPKDNPSFEYLIYLRVGGAGGPRSTGSTGSSPPSSSSLSSFLPTALWYLLSVRFAGFVDFFEWFFLVRGGFLGFHLVFLSVSKKNLCFFLVESFLWSYLNPLIFKN